MDYSVVIPVFNSENTVEDLTKRLLNFFDSIAKSVEIILVDDNSEDESWNVLKKLKQEFPKQLKILSLSKNFGQHNATFCGFKYCTGKHIITIDDDLQNYPEDITALMVGMENSKADIVYGIGKKNHSKVKKTSSFLWKWGAKNIDKGIGQGSSFRLMTQELKNKIINHQQSIIFIDEIVQWHTQNVGFVAVEHYPRLSGKTGYSFRTMTDLMFALSFNYSVVPLKLLNRFGIVLGSTSFLFGIYFILRKLFLNVKIAGFTAIIVAIFFSTGLILIALGVIAKYLNNIFQSLHQKPPYTIKEKEL